MNSRPSASPLAGVFLAATMPLWLAPAAPAQAEPRSETQRALPTVEELAGRIRVPIHTAPSAYGIDYGTWAAGPNYKVSFHDGFAFYPVLGPDYPENLPLRWRTESVTVGGEPVFAAGTAPETAHTDWRFEYRYPGFVEAYDVRIDGVEQTFTLLRRPKKSGDLVVVGRIESRLAVAEVAAAHTPVPFEGPRGETLVRYGEAFALDARCVKTRMQTASDGERITLRVPDAWLRRATFPVTIDPLMSPVALRNRSTRPFLDVDVAAPIYRVNSVSFAFSLSVSASDSDAYLLRVSANDLSNPVVVYSDVTANWKTPTVDLADVRDYYFSYGLRSPVVLVMQRDFAFPGVVPTSGIAWHVNYGAFGTQSTTLASYNPARRRPVVGGASYVTWACIVWEQDNAIGGANTANTEVYAANLDLSPFVAPQGVLGSPTVVASSPVGTRWDREFPSISEAVPWVIAYQERASAGSLQTVHLAMFDSWLVNHGRASFAAATGAAYPKIGGSGSRFLVAFRNGTRCGIRPVDWNYSQGTAVVGAHRTLPFAGYPGAVAFDTDTNSHFCVTVSGRPETVSSSRYSQNHFYRLGNTLGILEQGFLGYGGTAATTPAAYLAELKVLMYDLDGAFLLAHQRHTYRSWRNEYSLLGYRLEHDPTAGNVLYGTGCAGSISSPTEPYAGRASYRVDLKNAWEVGQTAWLYVTALPASIYIRPGCYFNVDGNALVAWHARTIGSGRSAFVTFDLPDNPVFLGNYYMQWLWSDGNGTWYMTQGLRAQVRL